MGDAPDLPDRHPVRDGPGRMLQVSERELRRILLDLHDGPVQHMYAALSQLDLLRTALAHSTVEPEVHERGDRIRRLLEEGLSEIRSFIGAFHPPEFDASDLRTLLEGLVLQHEATTDTAVTLIVGDHPPGLALPVKIVLYRVLQEGLSNAYRHGGARHVIVRVSQLSREDGEPWLRLEVEDDGAGFDPTVAAEGSHFGLRGMRDRVQTLGGTLALRSAPSAGTKVTVEVPAL